MNPERFLFCVIQGDIYLICLEFEFAGREEKKKNLFQISLVAHFTLRIAT